MTRPEERPTCPVCGSEDVSADATVWWNGEGWELSDGSYEEGSCQACSRTDITFVWIPAWMPPFMRDSK